MRPPVLLKKDAKQRIRIETFLKVFLPPMYDMQIVNAAVTSSDNVENTHFFANSTSRCDKWREIQIAAHAARSAFCPFTAMSMLSCCHLPRDARNPRQNTIFRIHTGCKCARRATDAMNKNKKKFLISCAPCLGVRQVGQMGTPYRCVQSRSNLAVYQI